MLATNQGIYLEQVRSDSHFKAVGKVKIVLILFLDLWLPKLWEQFFFSFIEAQTRPKKALSLRVAKNDLEFQRVQLLLVFTLWGLNSGKHSVNWNICPTPISILSQQICSCVLWQHKKTNMAHTVHIILYLANFTGMY